MLSSRVMRWRTWSGETDDAAGPDPRQMPWMRLTPAPAPIDFVAVNDYKVEFVIRFELAVAGTDVRHMMNYWEAVMTALRDQKPHRDRTVRKFLQDHGVVHYRIRETAIAPVFNRNGWLEARASVGLLMHISA
jgi:hypothetical protein